MLQIKIPHDLRVYCATQVLSDGSMTLWETVQLRRATETLSWDDFKTEFENQYYSKYHRRMKEQEFQDLRQEGMSVLKYERRFHDPSIRTTSCPIRTTHDRKVKGWLQTRIEVGVDCFTIQDSKRTN